MKNLFLFSLLAISLSFASCGGGVDCDDEAAFQAAVEQETADLFATAFTYAFDPTNSEACNAYKDAINAYLDAINPYRDCFSGSEKEEFDASLAETEQALNDLDC